MDSSARADEEEEEGELPTQALAQSAVNSEDEEEDANEQPTQALTKGSAGGDTSDDDEELPTQALVNTSAAGEVSDDDDELPTQALKKSALGGEESENDEAPTQLLEEDADMETQAAGAEGYDPEDVHDSQSQVETQVRLIKKIKLTLF